MSELLDQPLVLAADALRRGEISARELAAAALARIEDAQPRLNFALAIWAEDAMAAARSADERLARGEPLGPLHGVPLMHKDMFYRAGLPACCGSLIRKGFVPSVTASVLERLDAAGALDLGRLNMSEFAVGLTGHNVHYGDCRNPWSPAHITGGSSSGSGCVTAARCVFGALGSDTGGSIRLPATVNGVVGLKPTQTRVSRAGAMPLSPSLDCVGPLARTVADCARLFAVIAGHDPRDPTSSSRPLPAFEAAAQDGARGDLKGLRIGLATSYFEDTLDPEIAALMAHSRQTLQDLGAEIVEVAIPDQEPVAALQNILMTGEAASLHRPWLRHRLAEYSPQVRARLLPGLVHGAAAWQDAARLRPLIVRRFVEQVFARIDVLPIPALADPAPTLDATRVGDGPDMPAVIGRIGRCTRSISYLGLPALTLPMGLTANGLPAGLQLLGRPFAEALLLRVGAAFEAATGFAARRPPHAAAADPSASRPPQQA